MAAEGIKGNLVDARWLAKNLESPDLLILDASPRPMHAKNHIPGAVSVEVFAVATYGLREVQVQEIERMYQTLGLDTRKKVVLYDQGATWFAPRLFFSLEYHGFPTKNLYILDGGFSKWQVEGLPVTKEATPAPKPGSFRITKINEDARTRLPDLVTASGDRKNNVLVDALGPEYHYGAASFFNKAGHIPHAVLLPGEDFFNADKTFKSPEEIKKMLAYLSILPEQEIHAHCGGGGVASIPYFALKHLAGYPKVKLSIESQMGWLQDDRDLPFWTYAAPAMMRETEWLQSWGGKMMRMYGVARLSVVDVRPPGAYAQGHVPFALNVPAETFKDNVGDPRKLAEILGASGVDASHEAIVISGSGLTKEAALAFVMLEKLGQKKVSVFMDSMDSVESLDKMARLGFATTKDATIVGAPKKPTDMAVPPTTYAASVRPDITIADTNGAGGAYPKVFIASGASVPARTPDGKVVHVPYTDLLNADGTPKAAKDIWNILTKAGVPRYAELVTFSDDPGEAAANYFILKLMGYPDIKVLLI
jgi:thiosulfate/3-mercaptopyruvate sulfurtransferase